MRGFKIPRSISWSLVVIPIMMSTPMALNAQYEQNASAPKVNVSGYPPEIQRDYRLFKRKCSRCHSIESSLKLSMAPVEWKYWVKEMENRPSSNISDKEANQILAFLNYDETHRKAASKAPAARPPQINQSGVARGRQFYLTHNCNLCHTIGGKGGSVGPPLDDVGDTQTRDELIKRMQGRRAGAVMPPLPSNTTDQQINDLVDYLLTLKRNQ